MFEKKSNDVQVVCPLSKKEVWTYAEGAFTTCFLYDINGKLCMHENATKKKVCVVLEKKE
jgi:hypothetical protein